MKAYTSPLPKLKHSDLNADSPEMPATMMNSPETKKGKVFRIIRPNQTPMSISNLSKTNFPDFSCRIKQYVQNSGEAAANEE